MNLTIFFAALYVSEIWHSSFRSTGSVYAKARSIVLFDRIMSGEQSVLVTQQGPEVK